MAEAKVIFTLDGAETTIQCSKEDKMKDICQKYSAEIKINIDSLSFIYFENKINFELTFSNYLDSKDKDKNEIKISVYKNKNDEYNKEILKKVKSQYFIPKFFSYMDEKIKLKIAKCNKHLQALININLINYKFYSEKYIIKEKNGIVKEYYGFNDILIYEGEYLNGQRNGKGKEYHLFKGNLIFEGEYKNGKKNGKGKQYYDNGNLRFEGEYLNGKKWNGKGYDGLNNIVYELKNGNGYYKEYDIGHLIFEGEYLEGQKNGKGKEYSLEGLLLFEGDYKDGKRNGKGKEYNVKDEIKFEGEYLNGKRWNGKGYNGPNNIVYELKNGKGYVKEYDHYGKLRFEGEYLYGKKNGKGKLYDSEGKLMFEGEYLDGYFNGKGKSYDKNRNIVFEAEYLYNYRLRGKEFINNRLEYEGEYLFNKKWNGKIYNENGNLVYEIKNGYGKVKEYHENGVLKFDGEYLNGKRNGKGKEYDWNGVLIFEGDYLNGKKL